jgi:hypothetical protein
MTTAARDDRVNRNPLPRQGPGDASTDRYYHAGEFVSDMRVICLFDRPTGVGG